MMRAKKINYLGYILVVMLLLSLGQTKTAFSAQRFKDNNNGTVTDSRTNLMWEKLPHEVGLGTITWKKAVLYCKDLSLAGHKDWRLPSLDELESLYEKGLDPPRLSDDSPFENIEVFWFWSSTIYSKNNTTDYPWVVYPKVGYKLANYSKIYAGQVLAVRNAR